MNYDYRAVLSPCIGVCSMGDDGLCEGCLRTTVEIARWSQMNDDERLRLMESVLPVRESARAGFDSLLRERSALRSVLHPLTAMPTRGRLEP